MVSIPRVVVAAAASGQGKTSIATGLLAALRARGLEVSPHKVGPDYIDPGYHGLAAGRVGRNLDPWLVGEDRIVPLFLHGAMTPRLADVAIVEGVMGLFDGATGLAGFASTAHVSTLLRAPVILVVDAAAVGRSVAALVHGFATFDPSVRIGGVILNRVGSDRHRQILADALAEVGVPVLGAVRRQQELMTPSRHLGLIPAAERSSEARRTVEALGAVIAHDVDLESVLQLAKAAPDLDESTRWAPEAAGAPAASSASGPRPVIAVAGGAAFTFSYAETPELLVAAGADVATFDPTVDEALPANCTGVVIGGGFPEVHAAALAANTQLRAAILSHVADDRAVAAECAGLLYLARALDGHPMCGVLPVEAQMTTSLTIGYREAVALGSSVLAPAGARVRGHEFHRTQCSPGFGAASAWRWRVAAGGGPGEVVTEGFADDRVHASYLHLHWAGVPDAAPRFVAAARAAQTAVR